MPSRHYTLPVPMLERLDVLPISRSYALCKAIERAFIRPVNLVNILDEKLKAKQFERAQPEMRRVSVSLSDTAVDQLNKLTSWSQLGAEHILRMAVDSYLDSEGI